MKSRPGLLLLGATRRGAGKTALACDIVRRFGPDVAAAKVTTVDDGDGPCPRGDGCGACGSLDGDFAVTEETDAAAGSDTGRLLRAGARPVFWLRARRKHLAEGLDALLARVPAGRPLACESNSARLAVVPDVFLVAGERTDPGMKPSCAAVLDHADRVVGADGQDAVLADLSLAGGRWALRADATALVLAGGASSRMGRDKALLEARGQPLIARVAAQLAPLFRHVLVSAAEPGAYAFLGLPVVADPEPGLGPLMGLAAGLEASPCDLVFVTACDVPVLDRAFVQDLLRLAHGHDAVVPVGEDGRPEPLLAVYRKDAAAAARAVLAGGGRRVADIFPRLRLRTVPLRDAGWYRNLNTPADYRAFLGGCA